MSKDNKYALIGYASDLGGLYEGARVGPRVMRSRGLLTALRNLSLDIEDLGDVTSPLQDSCGENEKIACYNKLLECHKALNSKVNIALKKERVPIVLGGDHSLSIGSFSALAASTSEETGLLWIDTHPDINTPDTSPSNKAFGMPIACLTGKMSGYFEELSPSKSPPLKPENLIYIGLRDVDSGEKRLIKEMGIKAYSMHELDLHGIGSVVREAVNFFENKSINFAVSFDLDVCDPSLVPGTGTPKRGGLTFREAHLVLELLSKSQNIAMWELVELNPLLDHNFETADLAISLLESALGKSIL